MKTILAIVILLGAFAVPSYGDSIEILEGIVNASMTRINDYRNDFVTDLQDNLAVSESRIVNDLSRRASAVSESVKNKLEEAEGKGVDGRVCVQHVGSDLNKVLLSAVKNLKVCMNNSVEFARRFAPFISNYGNTGFMMLEGFEIMGLHFDAISPDEAARCYGDVEWYTSAVSYNYQRNVDGYIEISDYIQNYLRVNVVSCFQRVSESSKHKFNSIERKAIACINEKMREFRN